MAQSSKKTTPSRPKPVSRPRKKLTWKKVWKTLWKVTWIGAIVVGVGITITFLWFLKDLPSPDKLDERTVVESTKILDRSGETVLYEIHGEEKRTRIELEQVSEVMQQAMISAEDKDFYSHFGFDPRGIARAFFSNVATDSRSGGSTITQQLVKNSILTPEQTLRRKAKELIIAIQVEIRFSKDEILEMYLNEIPYGSNAYGVQAASETFFGKSASDLELHEAATLAALPKAPTFYSPYGSNTDRLLDRRNWIMDRMVDDGFITQEEADAAKELPMEVKERSAGIVAGHFVDMVRAELSEVYGERIVEQGGLRVTTTLDMGLQHIAERVVPEGVAKGEANYGASNAALIAIHPPTGEVLALQGSRSYFDREHDGNVNVAIRERQPGSSFKPIIYAASFEEGYTPNTNLFDVKTEFGGGYSPNNYDHAQSGLMTMRSALQQSKNIPAVKALYLVGLEDAIAFASKLGITTLNDPARYGLSLVLGGGEVKLADMVSAFGVFANDGVRQPYVTILTVEDAEGKILIDNRDRPGEQVIDPQVARLITDVMKDDGARSAVFGSRSNLTLPDRPVAAKTGTTESYRDAWTVGATPDLAAGVWAGNNDGTLMRRGGGGFQVAAPIWNAFMREATAGTEVRDFVAPAPENTGKAVLDGRLGETEEVRLCKPSLKLATDRCPESQVEVKKFQKVHNILYYVNKDEPRGAIPGNPAVDPQFNSWENAVRTWAEKEEISLEDPPEEFDDTHDPEDAPKIEILTPEANQKVEGAFMSVEVGGSAEHGFKDVRFFIDGVELAQDASWPYTAELPLAGISSGFHTLTVRATDLIDNATDESIQVNVRVLEQLSVSVTSPSAGESVSSSDGFRLTAVVNGDVEPKTISMDIRRDSGETVYSQRIDGEAGESVYSRVVKDIPTGNYTTSVSVTDINGVKSLVRTVSFTVLP